MQSISHRAGADRQARLDRAQGVPRPADPRTIRPGPHRHQHLGVRRLQDAGAERRRGGIAGQRSAVVRHHPRDRAPVCRHPPQPRCGFK